MASRFLIFFLAIICLVAAASAVNVEKKKDCDKHWWQCETVIPDKDLKCKTNSDCAKFKCRFGSCVCLLKMCSCLTARKEGLYAATHPVLDTIEN